MFSRNNCAVGAWIYAAVSSAKPLKEFLILLTSPPINTPPPPPLFFLSLSKALASLVFLRCQSIKHNSIRFKWNAWVIIMWNSLWGQNHYKNQDTVSIEVPFNSFPEVVVTLWLFSQFQGWGKWWQSVNVFILWKVYVGNLWEEYMLKLTVFRQGDDKSVV